MDTSILGKRSSVVRFESSDKLGLIGVLSQNGSGSTCIIFIPGMGSGVFANVGLALSGRMSNTAVFLANNRGMGLVSSFSQRKGHRRSKFLAGTHLERFEDSIFDIKGAVNAVSRLGYKKIILCGHSTGCQKATYYLYKTGDRRVKGLILVAPTDDHNLFIKSLGRKVSRIAKECLRLVKSGHGDAAAPGDTGFSAQRLDSIINPKRIEGRLFNYEGSLKEFGRIKAPILAIFGSKEENSTKDVAACLDLLEKSSTSRSFSKKLIVGADHAFHGKEKALSSAIAAWISRL